MTSRVLILGAGGHGQVVADIVLRAQEAGSGWALIGFLDDDAAIHGQLRLGLPVLDSLSALVTIAHEGILLGIGSNAIRTQLFHDLHAHGERFVQAIHPKAILAPDVVVGEGTVIAAGVIVNTGTVIGRNVILNTGCTVDHHNHIGDHVHIGPGVHLGGDVAVGAGALVGIGATVMPQRRIGAASTIGAGALVAADVGEHATVVGVPARRLQ